MFAWPQLGYHFLMANQHLRYAAMDAGTSTALLQFSHDDGSLDGRVLAAGVVFA